MMQPYSDRQLVEERHLISSESIDGSASPDMTRRRFLKGSVLAIAIGLNAPFAIANVSEDSAKDSFGTASSLTPNAFVSIDTSGVVTIRSSYLEMGQGTFTGLATLAAEELDIAPERVLVVPAPADVKLYVNPILAKMGFGVQATGGSTAMAGAWTQMRQAAATVRAMLLTTAAKHWSVDVSTLTVKDGVILHAASKRSATYSELVPAAAKLPAPPNVKVKAPEQFTQIGRHTSYRVDVKAKTNGSAIYTQDIKLPGMLVAVVAHSPKLWAKVKHVDDSAARRIPGVVAVIPLIGDDKVQSGVAVLAANTWVARQGRDALRITWDDTRALRIDSAAIFHRFRELADKPGVVSASRGDVSQSAPDGSKVIEAWFEQPYLAHAPMEPMNCLVQLSTGKCDIWNGEQWHTGDQASAAEEAGLKPAQVTLHQLYAGGSFGRRANPRSDFVREAVRIARSARSQGINAPVKLVWMREDDMRAAQYRPLTVHKVSIAVAPNGNIHSWRQAVVGQSFFPTPADKADPLLVEGAADMPYAIANLRVEQHHPSEFNIPTQWLRSVGHTHTAFVGETMIDAAAKAAGKDPYAFRMSMLTDSSRGRERGVLALAAQKANWASPLPAGKPGSRRGRGIAFQQAFGTYVAQVAEVTVDADGYFTVDRVIAAVDCGTVINPEIVAAQIEGGIGFGLSFLRQEITFKDGQVVQSNFNDYPVLHINSMPRVEVYTVPSTAEPTGVGEPGVPAAAPAVINAVTAATGEVIHRLPLNGKLRMA
jgi:isoquinoline 1-oxidoreductase subunit beta